MILSDPAHAMTRALVALALLVAAPLASPSAQPTTPPDRPALDRAPLGGGPVRFRPAESNVPPRLARRVAPAAAVLLSVAGTVGALGLSVVAISGNTSNDYLLAGAALIVGPSAGNLVLEEHRDALVGSGLRAAGVGLVLGAYAATWDGASEAGEMAAGGAAIAGAASYVVGLGYDFVTAGQNAGRVAVSPGLDIPTRTPVAVVRVGM